MTRAVFLALLATALTTFAINQLFALPVPWAVVLSLTVGGVVLLGSLLSGAMEANWDPAPPSDTARADLHASTLAVRFAEAAGDQHRFTSRVQPRLGRMALAMLRERPDTADLASLDDPRARAALGPELHQLLTDPAARLPEPRRLAALLEHLERT
ncbi:hypothetical protein [Actinophytocola sp.]|uniref:hypothetical protein n=1 Tax=Actinophytocola sp. TaxID=1872138 RepID=UPI002D7FC228|nr:hypothetical protein [Actinophytocola sp.]HET9143777.1 hypothetical protein [Actinophytocola sp.]HEU5111627.1 hypothetical protein [Micromonosporaceae bacterium]